MSKRFPFPLWLVFQIAERDKWTCHICELGYQPDNPWEIDHDKPLAKGGTNHVRNLLLSHRSCNRAKAAA